MSDVGIEVPAGPVHGHPVDQDEPWSAPESGQPPGGRDPVAGHPDLPGPPDTPPAGASGEDF